MRESFIRAVQLDSEGVPAAVEGMLVAATNDGEVSRSRIREYRHEAAAVYCDMTPPVMVLVIGFIALRYISRGIGETELLMLAGVGLSVFWGKMFGLLFPILFRHELLRFSHLGTGAFSQSRVPSERLRK